MADRLEDDLLASIAGAAVLESCGCPKRVASAGGVDESNGRRWARGEPQNPVNRVRRIIESAKDPWNLVAFFVAIAIRAELRRAPMPEWRWRAMYLDALEAEATHDGAEDHVTQRMLMGRASLADQVAIDGKVAASTLKRLALGIVGQQKGWSVNGPRAH